MRRAVRKAIRRYRRRSIGFGPYGPYSAKRTRRLLCEPLEDRRLLSVDLLGAASQFGDFQGAAGDGLPAVWNAGEAQGSLDARATITVGGTLTASTVWTSENVYLVTSDLTIPEGVTLVIEPGTVVKLTSAGSIQADGLLDVQSTADNRVVFTSWSDDEYGGDTNGDGYSLGLAGDWKYLDLRNSEITLEHCLIRYGGRNLDDQVNDAAVYVKGSPLIRGNVIEETEEGGIYVRSDSNPQIVGNTLSNGYAHSAIYLDGTATIEGNDISGYMAPEAWAVYQNGSSPINIAGNTILLCENGVYSQSTDATVEDNLVSPWTTGIQVTGGGTIRDNIVDYTSGTGISMHVGLVTGNAVTGCGDTGIRIGGGTVSNNTVTDSEYAIYQGGWATTYSGNTFTDIAHPVIQVGGPQETDVVWDDALGLGWPYLVQENVTVLPGKVLTVSGGSVVKFDSGRRLTVQGTCLIADAIDSPAVFTSWRDDAFGGDSNGDGPSAGSPGDWDGIQFEAADNRFEYALVRYGGVNVSGPGLSVRHVTFDDPCDPAIGISAGGAGTTIHNVNFPAAAGYGVRNDTGHVIDARNNYWGSPDGPGGVGPGDGAGVSGNVTYSPWLGSPATPTEQGPEITSAPNTATVALQPYAYDADGRPSAGGTGTIVWARILGPDDFDVDPNTGEITWEPATPGDYRVGVAASDDVGTAMQIWQVHVASATDTTPPQITYFDCTIIDGHGGLMNAQLLARFSEGVQVGPADVALLDSGGQTVPLSTVHYNAANHELTVVARDLTPNATYTLHLMDTITDDASNPLDGEFDGSTFPTGDGTAGGVFEASFVAAGEGEILVEVAIVPVLTPSPSSLPGTALPDPLESVPAGSTYYVEVWVQDQGTPGVGVTGGTVDLSYMSPLADASSVVNLDFDLLPLGSINEPIGLVDDLGGGTLTAEVGVFPHWARLGYVEFVATSPGDVLFEVSPGVEAFSRFGQGAVPWDQVDLDCMAFVTQASGTRVDTTLVRQPTPFDEHTTGEVEVLPPSLEWIDEWGSSGDESGVFWIEIWGSTPETTDRGISGFFLDLVYNTSLFTATSIEYGPAFSQDQIGSMDDAEGRVRGLGGSSPLTSAGDDRHVLLARVPFEPTAADPGTPHNAQGQYVRPLQDAGFAVDNAELDLVEAGSGLASLGSPPETELWPVMYDIDDDGRVSFGDLAYFAAAFQQNVGEPGTQFAWASDFDHSGRVDFGDLSFFAANFQSSRGSPIVYPASFPDAWRLGGLGAEAAIGPQASAALTTDGQAAVRQVVAQSVGSPSDAGADDTRSSADAASLHDLALADRLEAGGGASLPNRDLLGDSLHWAIESSSTSQPSRSEPRRNAVDPAALDGVITGLSLNEV